MLRARIFCCWHGYEIPASLGTIFITGSEVIFPIGPSIISTACIGVGSAACLGFDVTAWRLDIIEPYKAFHGLFNAYIVCIVNKADECIKPL